MQSITVTVNAVQYLAGCAVVVALILAGYWCGRADRRDGRVLGGIRENDARFEQMRALRERSRQRLAETLRTLHAVSLPVMEKTAPRWAPAGGYVIDADPEPMPDEQREVEPDDDGYPPNMRATYGAGRLPVEPRGDERMAAWPVNPPPAPGRHRIESDHQTRDLSAFVGHAAPPGVTV